MKALQRDPMAADKARRAEEKANKSSGLISIKLGGDSAGGQKKAGFKKGGFKSAFAPIGGESSSADAPAEAKSAKVIGHDEESDTEDEGYEHYDPRFPTD